jgi:hypothetical protein
MNPNLKIIKGIMKEYEGIIQLMEMIVDDLLIKEVFMLPTIKILMESERINK